MQIGRFSVSPYQCRALYRQIAGTTFRFPGWRFGEAVAHGREVPSQITRGRITLLWVLGQASLHNPNERSRRLYHFGCEAFGFIAKDSRRGFGVGLFLKGARSGGHLVEDGSK